MSEINEGGEPIVDEGQFDIPYTWTNEYMEWRTQDITLNRDRDYPRFSTEYFRRRWHWETGQKEGNAAFAITALVGALRANRSQRSSILE